MTDNCIACGAKLHWENQTQCSDCAPERQGTPDSVTWHVEHTDTFAGEANYCWVIRHSFEMPAGATQHQIVRKAKELIGETGARCNTEYYNGDTYRLHYVGRCVTTFITADY